MKRIIYRVPDRPHSFGIAVFTYFIKYEGNAAASSDWFYTVKTTQEAFGALLNVFKEAGYEIVKEPLK